jgi:2'-5' RNA ligase
MRLFVSVDLPPSLADAVEALQQRFAAASGLSFTDPAQAHVTLKFLGDVPEADVDDLAAALERAVADAGVAPFEAAVGGLGVFPSLDYISVLWVGFRDGSAELTALHEAVEERTTALGFDPEDHAFTPHVTLARMEHAGGKDLVRERVREDDPTVGRFRVEEVRLTESTLGAGGPTYETLRAVPLVRA